MDEVSLPDLCLRLTGATVYPFVWLVCPKLAFPCAIPGKAHLKDILYNLPEKRASVSTGIFHPTSVQRLGKDKLQLPQGSYQKPYPDQTQQLTFLVPTLPALTHSISDLSPTFSLIPHWRGGPVGGLHNSLIGSDYRQARSLRSADDAKLAECFLITKGEEGTLLFFK